MSKIIFNRDIEVNGTTVVDESSINSKLLVDTGSYYGLNTTAIKSSRDVVDDGQSHHYYDKNGPNSDNLQYLQLTDNTEYPTNTAAGLNASYYEDASGAYMFGVSTQSLHYSNVNLNRLKRREIFNILQDIESIDASFSSVDGSGYAGFVDIFNNALFKDKNDKLATGIASKLGMAASSISQKLNGAEDVWAWGNYCTVWRYNLTTKQIISRQIANMNKELDPSGNWLLSSAGRGPVTSFGDGRFCVSVPNASTNGVLVFDKDLNPITNVVFSSYDTFGPVNLSATNFKKRGERSFGINNDQYNSLFVKKFNISDLEGYSYKSIVDNSAIDVHNTGVGVSGEAIFLYLSSSSQGQYSALEATGSMIQQGIMTPVADYKWNQARGKVIQYAMHKDNLNKWKLTPVNVFYTGPDEYKKDDTLQIESFNRNPETNIAQDLKILYPLFDNRDTVVDISGYDSLRTSEVWTETFNEQLCRQTNFSDGSSNTLPITAGLQYLSVNIYDVSGGDSFFAYKSSNQLDGYKFYQDVYSQSYKRFIDASGDIYYKQNDLNMGQIILSDVSCAFYPYMNPKKYIDLSSNITYSWNDASSAYLNNSNYDPYFDAEARKIINNNGFGKRYMFSPYQLDPSANGISNSQRTLADGVTTVSENCPFSDISSNTNPLPPPFNTNGFSSANKNTGHQHIKPQFYFPSGHVFDSQTTYYSRPYSLTWTDNRKWIGAYANGSGVNANPRLGKTTDLSGALVKEFFKLCQTAQGNDSSLHAVQVLLEGESYTDLSGADVVPSGNIVFKVKGEVLANQPIIMKLTPQMVTNNVKITTIMASQLSYYGAGIYGKLSLMQDENNKYHMFGGSSNTNYIPLSDMFYPAEYAITKLGAEIQKILNDDSSSELYGNVSKDTLIKLGFNNVVWGSQPTYDEWYWATTYKTCIKDVSGRILLSATLKGINAWQHETARYTAGLFAKTNQVGVDYLGNPMNWNVNVAQTHEFATPATRPDGKVEKLSGEEFKECEYIKEKIIELRGLSYSSRGLRQVTARPWCVNPKDMELEHIVIGRLDNIEIFGTFTRDYHNLTPDTLFLDSGINRDEVHGVVTSGSNTIGSGHKSYTRTFSKSLVSGKTFKDLSGLLQYPGDSTRKNFAVKKFTALGLNKLPNGKFTYGSSQRIAYTAVAASIGGANCYVGKYKGRDVFINHMGSFSNTGAYTWPIIVPILEGVKYNNFEYIRGIEKTTDEKSWILPSPNLMNVAAPNTYTANKYVEAYTTNEKGEITPLWVTVIPIENYVVEAGTNGAGWGGSWGGVPIVNDLIFCCGSREMYVLKASTGEVVAKYAGSDIAFNEVYLPDKQNTTAPDVQQIGQVNYAKGQLHLLMGSRRLINNISAFGRNIGAMSLKYNDKLSMPYSTFDCGTGNVDVVFKPNEALEYNSGKFVLLTTFMTNNKYNKKLYNVLDTSYNMLYLSGVTAIGVDLSSDYNLLEANNSGNFNNKFINGGSWFQANNLTFESIKSKIRFLYAGQIPYKVINQSPYLINKYQEEEARIVRNQKLLLSEYNRIKNSGSTYPYPDNGYLLGSITNATSTGGYRQKNTLRTIRYITSTDNTTKKTGNASFNPYNFNSSAPAVSQIYNQSLTYTDVGKYKAFAGQPGYDQYGTPL